MIQSGYHCFLPFPIHYSESFQKQEQSDKTVYLETKHAQTCINLNKTGHLLLLRSWTRRQHYAFVATCCCVTPSNRQDTQPSKRRKAPNSTSLHCLQDTEVSCELHDSVFETVGAVCALLPPQHLPLHLAFTEIKLTADKSTSDRRHIKWP